MSLRLDPRRVQLLKQMAAETGMRPGELVLRWVQERIDAERAGGFAGAGSVASQPDAGGRVDGSLAAELAALAARVDALTRRVEELSSVSGGSAAAVASAPAAPDGQQQPGATAAPAAPEAEAARGTDAEEAAAVEAAPQEVAASDLDGADAGVIASQPEQPARRRRGRPRKTPTAEGEAAPTAAPGRRGSPRRAAGETDGQPRVPLHEEITAVLSERGPMSAADLASAITERGRYVAQRTTKPLDANQVNSRVSHPHYRGRFVRRDGKIALADSAP